MQMSSSSASLDGVLVHETRLRTARGGRTSSGVLQRATAPTSRSPSYEPQFYVELRVLNRSPRHRARSRTQMDQAAVARPEDTYGRACSHPHPRGKWVDSRRARRLLAPSSHERGPHPTRQRRPRTFPRSRRTAAALGTAPSRALRARRTSTGRPLTDRRPRSRLGLPRRVATLRAVTARSPATSVDRRTQKCASEELRSEAEAACADSVVGHSSSWVLAACGCRRRLRTRTHHAPNALETKISRRRHGPAGTARDSRSPRRARCDPAHLEASSATNSSPASQHVVA